MYTALTGGRLTRTSALRLSNSVEYGSPVKSGKSNPMNTVGHGVVPSMTPKQERTNTQSVEFTPTYIGESGRLDHIEVLSRRAHMEG